MSEQSDTIDSVDTFTLDDFDAGDYLAADDTELEFSAGDFTFADIGQQSNRYVKPRFATKPVTVDYSYARDMARDIQLYPGEQIHAIVGGNFIFGDLLEALLIEKNVVADEMLLSTLSLSQNNIDSLAGMLEEGRVRHLTLAVSNYFYSHERQTLIPYLLKELDIDSRLDLAVVRTHAKVALMSVSNIRLVMTGSANLRSSRSIEQFALQESPELYQFYRDWFSGIVDDYGIIDKEVAR